MWGAVIGDLAGSIYEYVQIKKISPINNVKLISNNAFYSDDTILTIAILDAIEHNRDYERYLREYGKKFLKYKPNFEPYFNSSFSPGFVKWLQNTQNGKSKGNGALMRISPVGFMFDSEQEVITNSKLATIPSHNSYEAIACAEKVALLIYYAREGMNKEDIIRKLGINAEYKPFEKFNTTCNETLENCMYALLSSNSFEESVIKVISYGGDTDTNAAIVGAMAEALYGIDEGIIEEAKKRIPQSFISILDKGYKIMETNMDNDIYYYER